MPSSLAHYSLVNGHDGFCHARHPGVDRRRGDRHAQAAWTAWRRWCKRRWVSSPFSGDVFVFRGRRGDLVKLLWWSGDGMNLYAKRLERGRFVWPQATSGSRASDVRRNCRCCWKASTGGVLHAPAQPSSLHDDSGITMCLRDALRMRHARRQHAVHSCHALAIDQLPNDIATLKRLVIDSERDAEVVRALASRVGTARGPEVLYRAAADREAQTADSRACGACSSAGRSRAARCRARSNNWS